MTILREAAAAALEAIEDSGCKADLMAAADALRAALAEPEPRNQCGETCERAKLCAVCASELAEPQEPVAKVELMTTGGNAGLATRIVEIDDHLRERLRPGQMLYTHPAPQRQPLTDEEILAMVKTAPALNTAEAEWLHVARAIEQAHGIGGQDE